MKRAVLALAACGTPQAQPVASHVEPPASPPCPDHVERTLHMSKVDACVYGHFPRDGWIVFASRPSQVIRGVEWNHALVWRDGTVAFGNVAQGSVTAETLIALDLDGDGTDELVRDFRWTSEELSGESLLIYRVTPDKLDELIYEPVSYANRDDSTEGCTGKVVIANHQVSLDVVDRPAVPMSLPDGMGAACLFDGHHAIDVAHGAATLR